MGEADEIADLGDDHHGGDGLESAKGHEGLNDGLVGPGLAEELHVRVVTFDAFEELLDLKESFLEDDAVGGELELEVAQEAPVHARPVGLAGIVDAEAAQQGEDAGAGTAQIIVGIDPGAAKIADGLVGFVGDAHGGEFAGAQESGELAGVLLAWPP